MRGLINGVIPLQHADFVRRQALENIRLTFKDGKIVDATSSDTAAMNAIFDTDPAPAKSANSLGFNPTLREADVRHSLMKRSREHPFHAGPLLHGRFQREPLIHPLGSRASS